MISDPDYEGIKFPVSKKDFSKIEKENNICINIFSYENDLTYPVYVSDQKFENRLDLITLLYINDFNRFMCNKTKKTFANAVYNVLAVKKC